MVTGFTGDLVDLDLGPSRPEAYHVLLFWSPPLKQHGLHLATSHVSLGALES